MARSVTRQACLSRAGRTNGEFMAMLLRLAVETDGQDLIEYALLTTFIGFAGAAAWIAIQTGLGNAYSSYITAAWNLWEPADPVGGGA
jgi:Flp pilus assembly pilin Flp